MSPINKWFNPLIVCSHRVRELIPAVLLSGFSYFSRPHLEAWRATGIRIVGITKDESQKDEVWRAFSLLARYDDKRTKRVKDSIRIIFLGAVVRAGFTYTREEYAS